MPSEHKIELLKPTAEHKTRRYNAKTDSFTGENFDRGERIIMVDGVRWGRTFVSWHGVSGTKTTFQQDHDHGGFIHGAVVRSMRKRGYHRSDNWRSTEELTLEKTRELVASGQLRDPNLVKKDNNEAMARYRESARKAEEKKKKAFRARACQALGINQDDGSEIIDKVVAAMKWAQTQ